MNKHVESLPKVDKSITFHYCIVICDILQHIDIAFLKKTTQIVCDFFALQVFSMWANLRLLVNPKAKSVSALGGLCPLIP